MLGVKQKILSFSPAGSLGAELQLLPAFLLALSLFYCTPSSAAGTCMEEGVAMRRYTERGREGGGTTAPHNILGKKEEVER